MDATVVIKFKIKTVIDWGDLAEIEMTLTEYVVAMLADNGILGVVEDDYEILEVTPDET